MLQTPLVSFLIACGCTFHSPNNNNTFDAAGAFTRKVIASFWSTTGEKGAEELFHQLLTLKEED